MNTYTLLSVARLTMPLRNSKEIAARAGVSQATVSRVINNKSNVHEETRRRVLKVIEELGSSARPDPRGDRVYY
ncbi:MAG: LacI family DNA-binding transcriptional regulator [Anaerolineae bacterium]